MRRSLMACCISILLRPIRMTVGQAKKSLLNTENKMYYEIPKGIKFPRKMEKRLYGGMEVFESPASEDSKTTLLYIHGGAYFANFLFYHWKFLSEVATKTGCAISAPNYPLTPNYSWKESHQMMMNFYKQFVKTHDMKKVIIGGDSAGGGYVVSLLQQAIDLGLPLPSKMFLLSPWVDVGGGDKSMDKKDAMIEYDALKVYGEAWAKGTSTKDPIVSPLYGDMHGLPTTGLWVGTWEVLFKDCMTLCDKLRATGVKVDLHIGEKMGHVFPLYPWMREAKQAKEEIMEFIEKEQF